MQHLPFAFQADHLLIARRPLRIVQPGVVPDMELLQRQGLDVEMLERRFRARRHVSSGEHGGERPIRPPRPFVVERRHFGGDPDATGADVVAQHLADEALAVSGTVRQRGIEERDALVHGRVQRLPCHGIVDAAPHVGAEPPAAEADLADGVAGGAQGATFHARSSRGRL